MAFKIKQIPEDFIVRESHSLQIKLGRFAYYRLSKRGWTTQSAVNQVARALGKRLKFINYSGNKDKQALTEQHISILHGPKKGLELQGGDIKLEYLGQGRDRLNLGASPGNDFEITVRNLAKNSKPGFSGQIPNYFDEQRFGMNLNNHVIGKLIVKRDFEKACKLIPETSGWLRKSPRDYVGALRSLPKQVLRIYVHAYQSFLWNKGAVKYLEKFPHRKISWALGELVIPEKAVKSIKIPIIGYDSKIPRGLGLTVRQLLKQEGISLNDFKIKQFPEFDLKGHSRNLMVEPKNLEIGPLQKDDLNPRKRKCLVKFFLPSGSYATMVIKAIFP